MTERKETTMAITTKEDLRERVNGGSIATLFATLFSSPRVPVSTWTGGAEDSNPTNTLNAYCTRLPQDVTYAVACGGPGRARMALDEYPERWAQLRELYRLTNGTYTPLDVPLDLLVPDGSKGLEDAGEEFQRAWRRGSTLHSFLAHSEHFAHFAHFPDKYEPENVGLVTFFPTERDLERDVTTTTKLGKYLTKYFSDQLPSPLIATIANNFSRMNTLQSERIKLGWARTENEMEHAYRKGPRSCMSHSPNSFNTDGLHPSRAYASPDLAVAYIKERSRPSDEWRITARTVVNMRDKCFGRIYGNEDTLRARLGSEGYTSRPTRTLAGCRLLRTHISDRRLLMPYLDWNEDGTRDYATNAMLFFAPSTPEYFYVAEVPEEVEGRAYVVCFNAQSTGGYVNVCDTVTAYGTPLAEWDSRHVLDYLTAHPETSTVGYNPHSAKLLLGEEPTRLVPLSDIAGVIPYRGDYARPGATYQYTDPTTEAVHYISGRLSTRLVDIFLSEKDLSALPRPADDMPAPLVPKSEVCVDLGGERRRKKDCVWALFIVSGLVTTLGWASKHATLSGVVLGEDGPRRMRIYTGSTSALLCRVPFEGETLTTLKIFASPYISDEGELCYRLNSHNQET